MRSNDEPNSALLPGKNREKKVKKVQFVNVTTDGEESGDKHDLNQNNEGSITGSVLQSEDDLGLLDSGGGTMINHSLETGEEDNSDLPADYM